MLSEFLSSNYLEQEWAASEIERKFGEKFVYFNENGNLAIERKVLQAFRNLTEKDVVWDTRERAWRRRERHDAPGRRAE